MNIYSDSRQALTGGTLCDGVAMGGVQWVLELKEAVISTKSKTNSTPALLEFGLRLSLAISRNISPLPIY